MESFTTNKCDVCNKGFYLTNDGMRCTPTPDGKDEYCDIFNSDFSVCSTCKKGYVFTDKCVVYNVEGCKYY